MQININEWEASIKSKAHFSLAEINNQFFALNSDVNKLSMQARMVAVSTGIHRDITNLSDTLFRTKWLGLRNASSQIDVSNPRPEIRADLPSLLRKKFSNTGTPVDRNFSNIKVQNQTLSGSEPNIDRTFEGGNLNMSLIQVDNAHPNH